MPFIEKDALLNTPDAPDTGAFSIHPHTLKSFIATPRHDPTLLERFRSLFKSELKPGQYITRSKEDGLRYMFLITSNSYEDRDSETITSKALEAYEASCYPGEGLFHCDNPFLWWHDDDVVMGEIVAVNYSTPFLVEVAKELPTPTARILWDYAERNGDKAGTSHRFGFRDEDLQPDGSYTHIIKQETSYLPERELAANLMTYAGVIDKTMSIPQSDARLNEVFSAATGGKLKEAAALIHAKSGKLEKALAELGITHKAKADDPEEPKDEPKLDEDGNPIEEEKVDVTLPDDFMQKLQQLNAIYQMMMDMMTAQGGMAEDLEGAITAETELAKSFAAQKTAQKTAADNLEQRVAMLEGRMKMQPRSVQRDAPATDIDKLTASLAQAEKEAEDANLVESPLFGKVKPSPFGANGKG